MNIILHKYFSAVLLVLITILSAFVYKFDLYTSEYSFTEIGEVVLYSCGIGYIVYLHNQRLFSKNILIAGIIVIALLIERELNLQRNIFSLFMNVDVYREKYSNPLHIIEYLALLYFIIRVIKYDFTIVKKFLKEQVLNICFIGLIAIASQVPNAMKTPLKYILVMEETLELTVAIAVVLQIHCFKLFLKKHLKSKLSLS